MTSEQLIEAMRLDGLTDQEADLVCLVAEKTGDFMLGLTDGLSDIIRDDHREAFIKNVLLFLESARRGAMDQISAERN